MKTQQLVIVAVGAVIIAALAFYGGMQYQKSQGRQAFAGGFAGASGQFGGTRGAGGTAGGGAANSATRGRPVVGSIVNQDASSFTVKLADGSTKIVLIDDKTIFDKTSTVPQSEVKTGENVGVFGITNTDGSITAQNVQLNPQFRSR